MNLSFVRSIGFLFFEKDTEYAAAPNTFSTNMFVLWLNNLFSDLSKDQSYNIYAFVNTTIKEMLNSNGVIEVAVLYNDTSDQSTTVNRFF